MECPSPSANSQFLKSIKSYRKRRRHTANGKYLDSYLTLKIGFIMDNVAAVKDLEKHLKVLQSQIVYVQDPKYFQFSNTIKSYKGDTLVIEVSKHITEAILFIIKYNLYIYLLTLISLNYSFLNISTSIPNYFYVMNYFFSLSLLQYFNPSYFM